MWLALAKVALQKPCPSVRSVPIIRHCTIDAHRPYRWRTDFTIDYEVFSTITSGEVNSGTVNTKSRSAKQVVRFSYGSSSKTLSVGTVITDGKTIHHQ